MANFEFTSGIDGKFSGYVHTAAIAALQGFSMSQDADQYEADELSVMAYRVACDYVRECESARKSGIAGMPPGKYPLVFKHALTSLSGIASGYRQGDSLDGIASKALHDATGFVQVGDLVNEDLRGRA